MPNLRPVHITISNIQTADVYQWALSYPDRDFDNDGEDEVYTVPVYKAFIEGKDSAGKAVKKKWTCLRFMPFWNDPHAPNTKYRHRGWANAGLRTLRRKAVRYYNPSYEIQNTHSDYNGGIQLKGNFLIHAGPTTLQEKGWGSAGCVEIVGNFGRFKKDIALLSGSTKRRVDAAIKELVGTRKLFVEMKTAHPPNFRNRQKKTVDGGRPLR